LKTLAAAILSLSVAVGLLTVHVVASTPNATPSPTPIPTVEPTPSPTPSPSTAFPTLTGFATFYDATRNGAWFTQSPRKNAAKYNQEGAPYVYYAAASPRLRAVRMFKWGWEPYRVIVSNPNTGIAIVAWVVDECACVGGALIDLAPVAWKEISGGAPFGRGIQPVIVEVLP
jgi:hypothetical protein